MKRWISAITGLLLAASGPTASAKDLPNIDASLQSDTAPRGQVRTIQRSNLKDLRGSGVESLPSASRMTLGNPSQLDERVKSALRRMSPEQAARVHLSQLIAQYQLPVQVASALPASVKDSGKGPILVTFKQELNGVEVFRQQLTLLMNARNELVATSGELSPHATAAPQSDKLAFTLDARAAIARAFEDLNGERLDVNSLLPSGQARGPYTSFALAPVASASLSARLVKPARTKRVFFPLQDGLVPAWYVELNTSATNRPDSDYYSYVVSAKDGRVLFRHNLTANDAFSYRVWAEGAPEYIPQDGPQGLGGTPHPTGLPDYYQAPFVAPNLITLQSAPFSQNDPWLPAGSTETVGNNVDAYVDLDTEDGRTGTDFRATTTAPNTFDRVYDVTQEPDVSTAQQMATVTNLFYVTNFLHDWFYDFGFDEAAGNAQTDNYGRGGIDGDVMLVEAQDSSGLNNANMQTPSDGDHPRMQMYLYTPNVLRYVDVLSPPGAAGRYFPGTAEFGPFSFDLTAEAILVQDAGGASLSDGCELPFANAAQVAGKIAVMDRGNCNFILKAQNAQAAGAVGVIIANNQPGAAPGMAGEDPTLVTPTYSLSQEDGTLIKEALATGPVSVRMYGAVPGIFRDGALDNAIVAHEWGHYISNRLIYDANGLVNNQGDSMGEGWADFHALLMMAREQDRLAPGNENWQGAYGTAGYASSGGDDNNGFLYGGRRYPYSTDFTKNPLTFKHIEDGVALPPNSQAPRNPESVEPNSEVHNSGEVWASMLWECYTALLRDSSRLTFAEAQERMKLYVVYGYQLTPAAPTFLEARDAILAVANLVDPMDFQLCHAAFARRGAGLRAQAPSRFSTTHAGVVEGFATGKDVELTGVGLLEDPDSCDGDGVLDNGEDGWVLVRMKNTGTAPLTQTTAQLTAPPGAGFTFAGGGLVTFPPMDVAEEVTLQLPVTLNGPADIQLPTLTVTYRDAEQAIPGDRSVTFQVRVNTDDSLNASATDDVEANTEAWAATHDPELDLYSPWLRYEEAADVHYYYGPNPTVTSDIYLTSPLLHVSPTGTFSFAFKHRYDFEFFIDDEGNVYFYDGGVIELSNDGGQTWTDLGQYIAPEQGYVAQLVPTGTNPLRGRPAFAAYSPNYPDWEEAPVVVNLGTAYQGQMVQIRFRIGGDVNTAGIGWDIDDLVFSGITNTPFPVLVGEQDACGVNQVPVANAGPDQTVDERTSVTLNGASSSDPDGDALTYAWTQTAGPSVTLSDASTAQPTFTAPSVATDTVLTFSLTVSDGALSHTDTVNVTVRNVDVDNRAPVADAGPDQAVDENTMMVTLTGASSTDPDGDTLTYAWTQTFGPEVTLTGANTATPTFTAPEVSFTRSLSFELTVSDGELTSTDTVTVTVNQVNRAPVANAGTDRTVYEREETYLDGSGSMDADFDPLTYAWTQTAGPTVTLSDATAALPTFTAPEVTTTTVLTFSLTVSDGTLSSTDTVDFTVNNDNRAPVANAGPDQTVNEGATVTLDASGSTDPDGDALSYSWAQTAGPSVVLSDITVAQPTFVAPDVTADTVLTFRVLVYDASRSSEDTVSITVNNVNRAPVANAGPDQTVNEGASVTLNGGGSSDPDGTTLTYAWTQTAGPTVTLSGDTTATPTFTAPSVTADTVLTFTLTVSDGTLSSTDTVNITVNNVDPQNRAPVANAGADQTVDEGASVTLNGTGSSDPDGDTLTYAWTQTDGPSVTLSGANTAQPTFTAPSVDADTVLTFTLTVSDGALSHIDTVNITVRNVDAQNRAPVANAGANQTVDEGAAVTLNGTSSSDPDGDTLTYAWVQTTGPSVTLSDANTAQPTFTAPNVAANTMLTFELTVSDGALSNKDTVSITVRDVSQGGNTAPVANAGADQTVDEGASVTLNGTGSSDPNGDTLTYAWTQTDGPSVTLSGANTAQPTFTAPSVDADTVLTFTLTVSDGALSHIDTVNITVRNVDAQNRAPAASAGSDHEVQEGATVSLSGSGTDPEGGTLTYAWTQTAGPTVTLTGADTATASFTAPDVSSDTVLTFTLTVTDPGGLSAEDSVSITVKPENGGGGGGGGGDEGGCACSSDSSAAGSLMPLLMIGMALLSRRRKWLF